MLWHIGILIENFVELRIYFMNSWIMCAVTSLQYCGTIHLTRVLVQYLCVHTAGTSAGHM